MPRILHIELDSVGLRNPFTEHGFDCCLVQSTISISYNKSDHWVLDELSMQRCNMVDAISLHDPQLKPCKYAIDLRSL